eukprot:5720691-Prymnesium_polylepis.1
MGHVESVVSATPAVNQERVIFRDSAGFLVDPWYNHDRPSQPDLAGPLITPVNNNLCDVAVTVFSHRGALGLPSDSPIVSEHSLRAVAASRVPAADLDLFWTQDHTIFVGHPVAMQAHLA